MTLLRVGISDYAVARAPKSLMTIGLGSCVGVALYHEKEKVGGLAHILLPDSSLFSTVDRKEKFADLAIPMMVEEMEKWTRNRNFTAKMVGGAHMFSTESPESESIGYKNREAVLSILHKLDIPMVGSHVGGNIGRTMTVNLKSFDVMVSIGGKELVVL